MTDPLAQQLPLTDLPICVAGEWRRGRGHAYASIYPANDSVYALAAGIWSRDYKRAWRIGRAVQAATVWINTYKQFSIATPFGGWRDSGIGREKGRLGILQYMEQKSLYWGMNVAPLPWAA